MPTAPSPVRPSVPANGKELYDAIMTTIEPELTSAQVGLVEQKYANDTEEQKQARRARYDAAFKKYEEAYKTYLSHLQQQVRQYKKDAYAWAEANENTAEQQKMADLSAQFSDISPQAV